MLSPNWSFQYGKAYYCRLKVIKNTSHEKKIMLLCVQLYLSEHILFMIHTNELDASSCRIKIPSNILICNHKLEDCHTYFLKFNYTFLK